MRNLTIKDVIRSLPFQKDLKTNLLEQFDTVDQDTQLEITRVCWRAFHQMRAHYQSYWQNKINKEVAEGKRTLETPLEQQVAEEVDKTILERVEGKQEDAEELAHIRTQLEKLIDPPTN